ncbi:MAG: 1-acyl-sn-glycerol-3-phosphate acyltransferase [Ginsengibacter sp.]
MFSLFLKLYWKLSGWKVVGRFPDQYKKLVMIVAPHTSWIDILLGFAARKQLNIPDAKFMAKKELFDGPFGRVFKQLGGTPVDRSAKHGMVDQAVALFNANEEFILAIAPEGTRRRVDKLRTGFYHIAKAAQVPIQPVGFDFKNKKVILGDIIITSDNEEADMKKIISFYANIQGQNPALDLRHLKQSE